ncbi:hypothetical protein EYF80_039906 [Liparis tanakae]|uniref:Uncharacterized protein n=1 Tax=Liparis tanakae TaxID=230148 RepID=A0A4Z2GAT7_9TELE|nr:hypothetical protein EYF80_039906 [Liparis tanakae]
MPRIRMSKMEAGMFSGSGTFLWCFSAMKACTTVMRFMVSVPVLSEQMAVALPIVSQASKWRTSVKPVRIGHESLGYFTFTEYAREMVTASGRPSGTATTRTVTPMMKNFTKNWMPHTSLSNSPALPICTASLVSLPWRTDFSFFGGPVFFFSSASPPSSLFSGCISIAAPSCALAAARKHEEKKSFGG